MINKSSQHNDVQALMTQTDGPWTPGPWRITRGKVIRVAATINGGTVICGVHRLGGRGGSAERQVEGNARLIAAAPDFVEALGTLEKAFDMGEGGAMPLSMIEELFGYEVALGVKALRRALEKAKGSEDNQPE
jgi:hypothetical protein